MTPAPSPGPAATEPPPSTFGGELRSLLRLASPIVVSQLGAMGMNTADTIMVGPLGANALAATGIGSAVHVFMVIMATGIIVGMQPLVSQAFGAGDRHECSEVLVQGLWVAVLMSAPVVFLSLAGEPILLTLGQEPQIAELGGRYLRALAWGVPPYFIFLAFRQYLEGMGITRPMMVITFIGLVVNILFNRILIYGLAGVVPAFGVAGTGHATSIVRWTMLVAMVAYVLGHRELRTFAGVHLALHAERLGRIVRIGTPVGAQMGLEVGLFSFAAVMMGWLGPVPLAAHQVTINIAATTFMVALGTSLGGSVLVGQHIGARRPRALVHAVGATYVLATGFMALCALLFLVAPRWLVGLYTPDPEILRLGSSLLFVAALFQVFDGAQVAGMSVLRGAADTSVPMLIGAFGYWGVGVPTGYWLAFHTDLGPVGVWAGLSLGLGAVAVMLAVRVRAQLRRPLQEHVERALRGNGTAGG